MPDVSSKTLYRDLRELVDKNVLKATGAKKLRMYKPINLK
jgi:DeoR/GlpR family transcriptional regulator of sugar metabolism